MSLVPDGLGDHARHQARALYRLDDTPTGLQLLIQTGLKPDIARLPDTYGNAELRDLTPLLAALCAEQYIAYRLAANPTKRLGRQAGVDEGKVVPLPDDQVERWWLDRAPHCGLTPESLRTHQLGAATGRRDGTDRIRHAITRFDGFATITDPTALRTAILNGVGRGKSYGCGLLSVAIMKGEQ
jgi:CRISPR system Cascade subunit CasE